jgi:hypothetical protein
MIERVRPVTRPLLRVIRVVMLVGVLAFGAAIGVIHASGQRAPVDAAAAWSLRVAFLVLLVVDLPAIVALRLFQTRAADFQRKALFTVGAWAVAAGLALLGGVVFLLTARPTFYLFGTLVLLASFLMVPVPPAADAADRSDAHA